MTGRRQECGWCRSAIPSTKRSDSRFCSKRCRQAHWRFAQHLHTAERAEQPLRLAYADPPYPGLANYYRDHPDYDGEVDHAELLSRLQLYDGWVLSTSAKTLPTVLRLCPATVRVGAWVRGERPTVSRWPLSAWEPVVFDGGRRLPSRLPGRDALVFASRPRLTDPRRVIGAKPAAFAAWVFGLLGARPGDSFDDLYPGSGGMTRAWLVYCQSRLLEAGATPSA